MIDTGKARHLYKMLGMAFFCALGLTLLMTGTASAHAILLSSSPTKDAVLPTPPAQVLMWFSEDLNPSLSTAQVINANRQRVDQQDAHVAPNNSKELVLSLKGNLPPAVYIVLWRSDSADDGHVLSGSFIFTVANADGTVPQLAPGANPGAGILGDVNTGNGTLDGPGFFNFIVVSLVELGAIFWVAGQLWVNFVLESSAEKYAEEKHLIHEVERRFEQFFSIPTLILLLIANLGVLYGQVLTLSGNNWGTAFSPALLQEQASSGRFGTYWLLRMLVLLVALVIAIYMFVRRHRPKIVNQALPLINLFLGALLFIAITMSGHAASVSGSSLPFSVVTDWLHLLAAALWVGGMFYILLVYLPVLKGRTLNERARSLLAVLPQYSPLAIAGVVLMAITGPFSATFHMNSFAQLLSTAYGRTLMVKIILVGALLATSAYHVGWLRPRLKREYKKFLYSSKRLNILAANAGTDGSEPDRLLVRQVKLREQRLEKKSGLLTGTLTWEPLLGVAVILCVGLLNVFAGTLAPGTATPPPASTTTVKPFIATEQTTDTKYSVTLTVSPNRFGTNVFTVQVKDPTTGAVLGADKVGVTVFLTMLDMDMGTQSVHLQADSKGNFSNRDDLAMGGNWGIKVQLRTPDNTLHEASFKIVTPF